MSISLGGYGSRANPSPYSPHAQRAIDEARAKAINEAMQGYYQPPEPTKINTPLYNQEEAKRRDGGSLPSKNTVREFGNYMLDRKRLSLQGAQNRAQAAQAAASDRMQISRMQLNAMQNGGQVNQLYGPSIARRLFGF